MHLVSDMGGMPTTNIVPRSLSSEAPRTRGRFRTFLLWLCELSKDTNDDQWPVNTRLTTAQYASNVKRANLAKHKGLLKYLPSGVPCND